DEVRGSPLDERLPRGVVAPHTVVLVARDRPGFDDDHECTGVAVPAGRCSRREIDRLYDGVALHALAAADDRVFDRPLLANDTCVELAFDPHLDLLRDSYLARYVEGKC